MQDVLQSIRVGFFELPQDGICVRNLAVGEPIPEEIHTGIEPLRLDTEWVWIVSNDDGIQGVLIAAPCHGVAHLLRLAMKDGAPKSLLLRLFRGAFAEMSQKGIVGFMVMFDKENDSEKQLMRMVKKIGGKIWPMPTTIMYGTIPKEEDLWVRSSPSSN